jgi:putative flippase GtrA
MSQIEATETPNRILRTPLDSLILAIAGRFGNKAKEVERFLKFIVVGVIGTAIDFGTVIVLQATLFPPTGTDGEPILTNVAIATTIAFIIAVISNYTFNRFWTYPDSRSRSVRRQLALFVFINFVGWFGRTIWITTAFHPLGEFFMPILLPIIHIFRPLYIPSYTAEGKLGTMIAQVIGVGVVMFWNFFANRYWTFNDVDKV